MKKLTLIFSVIFLFVAVESCKDNPLDITPSGRLSLDEIFSESESTLSYLNSTYTYIPRYGTHYFFFAMLAGITDNGYDADVVEQAAGVMAPNWNDGGLTPSNNPINGPAGWNSFFYGNWWQGIRKANVFIANIDDATLSQERESERARLKAEAKVLRAYFYLELSKEYGGMPILDQPLPPDYDYSKLKRESFDAVTQFIVKNCDEALAEPDLPWRITSENEAGRFTKAIAHAIKSEVLLYNASPLWNPDNDPSKWQAAAEASKEALNALISHGYELYPDYGEYFLRGADYNSNPSDKETIFEITGSMHIADINQLPTPGLPQFKAGTTPTQELVDSYDMQSTGEPAILGYEDEDHLKPIVNKSSGYDPDHPYEDRDPRFYATVWYNNALFGDVGGMTDHRLQIYDGGLERIDAGDRKYTNTGYYLRKFLDPKVRTVGGAQSTFKRFRLAEIYLNYAEAANEANGPTGEVYNVIKTVRARVNMPPLPSGLSKEKMRERIHNERRVELAIEEHRFWDVRRWRKLEQTGKLVTGMHWTKNDDTFEGERFVVMRKKAWESKYLIFPIPIDEVSKIQGLEQNPGW